MIEQAAREWRDLCTAFKQYSSQLDRVSAKHVNSQEMKNSTKQLAQIYFRNVRALLALYSLDEQTEPLTTAFQTLLELSEGRNLASSYKKQTKIIRRLIPRVTSQLELQGGASSSGNSSSMTDHKIIAILTDLSLPAAQCYQQAIADLTDPRRLSFLGPAHELRECLRQVLDKIAPDADVEKAPGYKHERDLKKPTMKQKVRFIFKNRERSATESAAPEDAANAIESVIADMTRSTYDHGSLAAHKERGKKSVEQLKRYVDVVFHDLLEL